MYKLKIITNNIIRHRVCTLLPCVFCVLESIWEEMIQFDTKWYENVEKYASIEEKKLVEYILENDGISRGEFEEIMECSKATAARRIKKYVNEKIIRQINSGRATYYELFWYR